MEADVLLVPAPPDPERLIGRLVIVMDILRATTTIVTALMRGARAVIPVVEVEEGRAVAARLPPGTVLLGGERGSLRIDGYDLGNSPREYTAEMVRGRTIVLTTTNGTRMLRTLAGAAEILVGCYLNLGAVARTAAAGGRDVLVACAGRLGGVSLEDVVGAGAVVAALEEVAAPLSLTDAARVARELYREYAADVGRSFRDSAHGQELLRLGLAEDLAFCATRDLTQIVPGCVDGVIRPAAPPGPVSEGPPA
ncbi:MAG: 2-phosphosulfolactate phosphatase [Deltaproteobacteria bacterium]|nr:2-phosphosulfolactate phosphatase [Deltaproteobacteria bacterium]